MQGFFIAALWLKLCNKKKDKMFEFQLSTLNEKVSNQIFSELKKTTAQSNAVLTSYSENGKNNIVVACDEVEKPRVCFFLSDAISDAISTFFKLEFVEDNLKIPVKNEISFQAFKKALVAFDRETDKYIVSRSLKIENELNLDAFYNFRLKQLRTKWLEIIQLANDNASYLLCSDTFLDLLKFLIDNIEISRGTINVVKEGNEFKLCDESFNEIQPEQCPLANLEQESGEVGLVTSLIALSPKKINVYCSPFENNCALTLISQIFENRVSILPENEGR